MSNPLLTTFWSMAAVRHGDYVAKIRLAPSTENATRVIHRELDLRARPEVFYPTLVDELQSSAFDFDLQVQLCTDLEAMPVNGVTVEWPEKLSPFVTVGRVHVPRQDISGTENFEKTDALAFNQWRVTEEHRPLGEIMRCDGSTARRPRCAGRSITSRKRSPQVQMRCCRSRCGFQDVPNRQIDRRHHDGYDDGT